MDTVRAKEILNSNGSVQVLFHGSPVWIENVRDNNTAEVTRLTDKEKINVPVYQLIENSPVK